MAAFSQQNIMVVPISNYWNTDARFQPWILFFLSGNKPPTRIKSWVEHKLRESNSVMEITITLHSVKNILEEHLTQNFIPIKVKEIVAEKCKEGLDKKGGKFCDGINSMYSMCVEYLDKGTKTE
jgi:hypothetical protein